MPALNACEAWEKERQGVYESWTKKPRLVSADRWGRKHGSEAKKSLHWVTAAFLKAFGEVQEREFRVLVESWKAGRTTSSLVSRIVMHPAYQQIIGMGPTALPLILAELERETDHWFWALKAISGEDPVLPQNRGKIDEMKAAWLQWGREKGYAR